MTHHAHVITCLLTLLPLKLQISDEVRNNISRRTEEIVFDILESTVIDQDIAFPLLTVLVKTNVTASDNR